MKKLFKILFILLLVLLMLIWIALRPTVKNPHGQSVVINSEFIGESTVKKKLDSVLSNGLLMNDYIGVTTGALDDQGKAWLGTGGFQSIKNKKRPNRNTRFRIASITKPMTAIAIMQLVEKGMLALDDKAIKYVSTVHPEITIRQLLNHTSGVGHYRSTLDAISFKQYDTAYDALNTFIDRPLSFEPGTGYQYTTYGYTILAAIIESATELTYSEYMQVNIWQPIGMKNTSLENVDAGHQADLYIKYGDRYLLAPKTNLSFKYAAGGVITTAEDMMIFAKAIINNDLLDSTTFNRMLVTTPWRDRKPGYGLGWYIHDTDEGMMISHGGSQSGSSSEFKIWLDRQVATVAIANSFNSDEGVNFLAMELGEVLLKGVDAKVKFHQPYAQETYQKRVGVYHHDDDQIVISLEGGNLYAAYNGYPPAPIFAKNIDLYFARHFDGWYAFEPDGNTFKNIYEGIETIYTRKQNE